MAGFLKKLFNGKNESKRPSKSGDRDDSLSPSEPDITVARAINEIQMRTQTAIEVWGLDAAAWDVDLEAGTITFTNAVKNLVVSAPVQVIGTLNTEDNTWLWGWDHPSVPAPLGEHARSVRDFGNRYGLEDLTTRKISASMDDAWRFTALGCHLGGAQGGYSGQSGSARVFMTYGTVTIRKLDTDQQATELVVELAKQVFHLAGEASEDWREVFVRFNAPSDVERGWKGSYVKSSGVEIFDVLQHKQQGELITRIGERLRDAMAKDGKKFVVCLVRGNANYQYQVDFEWSDEKKWNLSKLHGGTGLPEGLELLPPLV
jgi:hypothetical protein